MKIGGICVGDFKLDVLSYDTTLRDGSQGEGISLSIDDKLRIARKLDYLGISYIEGGWPGSNPKDLEFFQRVREIELKNSRITAFSSTRKPDIAIKQDSNIQALLQSGVKAATIFGKSWDFHVLRALETTLEENLAMIRDTVAFLKDAGWEVIFDAEHFFDGYKNNRDYALRVLEAAADAGADWLVLCDTNGGTMPWEVEQIVCQVREFSRTPLGIHAHNDGACAVANSLVAIKNGCSQVQGTINGYGERCGNGDLCSIIPSLELKMGLKVLPGDNLRYLSEVSHYVTEIANMPHYNNQPL
ncbi:citramalate synthase [Syntrophomonas palmitatica]|uniref:citramalate synthase n=1 Tax=Syntrophomonas palmitatica TaxID=402877 RepID=UPI000AEAFC01